MQVKAGVMRAIVVPEGGMPGSALKRFSVPVLEVITFYVAVRVPFWLEEWFPVAVEALKPSTLRLAAFLAALYFVLGAIPVPWTRRPLPLAIGSFLAPLGLLSLIAWNNRYIYDEQRRTWATLPQVMLEPQLVLISLSLSMAAGLGWGLRDWTRRRGKLSAA